MKEHCPRALGEDAALLWGLPTSGSAVLLASSRHPALPSEAQLLAGEGPVLARLELGLVPHGVSGVSGAARSTPQGQAVCSPSVAVPASWIIKDSFAGRGIITSVWGSLAPLGSPFLVPGPPRRSRLLCPGLHRGLTRGRWFRPDPGPSSLPGFFHFRILENRESSPACASPSSSVLKAHFRHASCLRGISSESDLRTRSFFFFPRSCLFTRYCYTISLAWTFTWQQVHPIAFGESQSRL
nr:uncharacterized protein LOC110567289 [Aotus nancymaae]